MGMSIRFIIAVKNEISEIRDALIELFELNTANHSIISEENSFNEYLEKFDQLVMFKCLAKYFIKI